MYKYFRLSAGWNNVFSVNILSTIQFIVYSMFQATAMMSATDFIDSKGWHILHVLICISMSEKMRKKSGERCICWRLACEWCGQWAIARLGCETLTFSERGENASILIITQSSYKHKLKSLHSVTRYNTGEHKKCWIPCQHIHERAQAQFINATHFFPSFKSVHLAFLYEFFAD